MLKNLSYMNLAFAFFYYLAYLVNSYSFAALGVLVIIVSNILLLTTIDKDLPLRWPNHFFQGLSLIFSGFLTTWAVNIFLSSLEYSDFSQSWFYLLVAFGFASCIITQSIILYLKKYRTE